MRTLLTSLSLIILFLNLSAQSNSIQSERLKLAWETQGFDTPECVAFDAQNNVYYVSNVGGKNPTEKDGNGFISKLKPDGSILQLRWIEGLNAPKGMTVFGGNLFVTDIDQLIVIDIAMSEIEEKITFTGALFLNDIVAGKDGALYITDSQSKTFYKFDKGKHTALVTDASFDFPNGIIYDGAFLTAGIGNSIIQIEPVSGKWSKIIDNTGGVDGLAKVSDNSFIISDWSGHVHMVYKNKEKELILDTTPIEGRNAADFYYSPKDHLVLIPTFFSNSVACYQLVKN